MSESASEIAAKLETMLNVGVIPDEYPLPWFEQDFFIYAQSTNEGREPQKVTPFQAIGPTPRRFVLYLVNHAAEIANLLRTMEAALKPFAEYADDQLERRLPRQIASDDATPMWGDTYMGEPQVTVGDLRKARAALAKAEPQQ